MPVSTVHAPSGQPILVTGASGNVGREVVRALRARGIPLRAAVGSVDRARGVLGPEVDLVRVDFTERSTWAAALAGCRGVFLLRPPAISSTRTTLVPFVDAARAAGARHVVFLSVAGAGGNPIVPHHRVEVHLQAGADPFTILRPGFFAQNLQDAYLRDVREDDRLYVPAGDGRVTFVDVADVAEVAVRAFLDPETHAGRAWTLTGPEALTFHEVAALLTAALGRPIRYTPASVVGYLRHLRARGLPGSQALVQTILHVGLRWGQAATVDPTLAELLGHRARPLSAYVAANAPIWSGPKTPSASARSSPSPNDLPRRT